MVTPEVYPKNHCRFQHHSVPASYAILGVAPHYPHLCLISLLPLPVSLLSFCEFFASLPGISPSALSPDPENFSSFWPQSFAPPICYPLSEPRLSPRPFLHLSGKLRTHPYHLAGPLLIDIHIRTLSSPAFSPLLTSLVTCGSTYYQPHTLESL